MQTLHKPKAPPRRVIAIDPPSLPNEGQRLIAQYDSGIGKFPLAITRAIQRAKEKDEYKEIGDALRQLLQQLIKPEFVKANISANYSLRSPN